MLTKRALSAGRTGLQLGLALTALACEPPEGLNTSKRDAGDSEVLDSEAPVDAGAEPVEATDASSPREAGEPDESDADAEQERDAWVGPPPPADAHQALCTDAYDSVTLDHPDLIRGSWQYNPGGPYVTLPESGYPCAAFLHDGNVRPRRDDPAWTDAANGEFLGFSESSTVPEAAYAVAQFRYFRSLVFVPKDAKLETLTVSALGIDDAVYLELFNSEYPDGVSPLDAGPSDPDVGACFGNDSASWDFKDYIVKGEVNVVFLVHADMNPATSTLTEVKLEANGEPIRLVSCKDAGAK
jgi:hypothetical protein